MLTPPGLRKQMMVKHAELAALWKAEKPDQNRHHRQNRKKEVQRPAGPDAGEEDRLPVGSQEDCPRL